MSDDGGPAFPLPDKLYEHSEINPFGMSLRDYFAAKAMEAIISHTELVDDEGNFCTGPAKGTAGITNFACFAYLMADAMLAARRQP